MPRVLGVDDWAWRKGYRYGTAFVDLERNVVLDLLPDRQAATLADWLRHHPGVEIVARDRAGAYADGVRQGAPGAIQVMDRWHVLRNLGSAMQSIVERHHAAAARVGRDMVTMPLGGALPGIPASLSPSGVRQGGGAGHDRRLAQFEEARRLHASGTSLSLISRQLGLDRKTLRGWLQADAVPSWRQPLRGSMLDPYRNHLDRRWARGCRNAARLWRELAAMGYRGRYSIVRAWAAARRVAAADALKPLRSAEVGLGGHRRAASLPSLLQPIRTRSLNQTGLSSRACSRRQPLSRRPPRLPSGSPCSCDGSPTRC